MKNARSNYSIYRTGKVWEPSEQFTSLHVHVSLHIFAIHLSPRNWFWNHRTERTILNNVLLEKSTVTVRKLIVISVFGIHIAQKDWNRFYHERARSISYPLPQFPPPELASRPNDYFQILNEKVSFSGPHPVFPASAGFRRTSRSWMKRAVSDR